MSDAYRIDDEPTSDEWGCFLIGPDDFVCRLGEPEDRIWGRDGLDAVIRLNEQHAEIERLKTQLAEATNLDCRDAEVMEANRELAFFRKWADEINGAGKEFSAMEAARDAAILEVEGLKAILVSLRAKVAAMENIVNSAASLVDEWDLKFRVYDGFRTREREEWYGEWKAVEVAVATYRATAPSPVIPSGDFVIGDDRGGKSEDA